VTLAERVSGGKRDVSTQIDRMGSSVMPALLAASAAAARERTDLDASRAARAEGAAYAVPLAALPPLEPAVLGQLVERGAVRERAPETFYRFVSKRNGHQQPTARRLVAMLMLAALLVLGPGLISLLRAEAP
jgi:hypothetical protein